MIRHWCRYQPLFSSFSPSAVAIHTPFHLFPSRCHSLFPFFLLSTLRWSGFLLFGEFGGCGVVCFVDFSCIMEDLFCCFFRSIDD